MKNFTREEAIKALEAKIPTKDKELDLGRTISEAVDNSIELIGEDSEMELNDFVEKVFKQVKTSIGLTHSENSKVATKMQSQIDELQKKVNGKNQQTDDGKGDDDDPKLKSLQEELDTIKKRFADEDRQKSIAEKRSAIINKMAESIPDKDWINDYMSQITVTEDTDVEAKAKDYVAFYNKTQANVVKRSTTPRKTGEGDDVDSDVRNTVKAAAQIKKSMSGGPVTSTATNSNNN